MPRCIVVDAAHPDPAAIAVAARILRAGGLVAFPTETVYGLGANALDADAVGRIFIAKGRPADDPLIVHVLDAAGASDRSLAAAWPPIAARLTDAFWPGPLTVVVPRGPAIPPIVTAGLPMVALRAPAHPVARALLAAAGVPIAAPSANPFGRTSPTTAAHVIAGLGDRVDLILDGGPCTIGVESTVVDCTTDPIRVLRPGGIPIEAIRAIAPDAIAPDAIAPDGIAPGTVPAAAAASPSPGTQLRHYAPRARLVLVTGNDGDIVATIRAAAVRLAAAGKRVGLLVAAGDEVPVDAERIVAVCLAPLDDPSLAAHRLFAALHALDAQDVDVILARDWPARDLGLALQDRLRRAAQGGTVLADGTAAPVMARS